MVRKADTLQSLEELSLSEKTLKMLRSMPNRYKYPELAVWDGRETAYRQERHTKRKPKISSTDTELIYALEREGFIRHDIASGSFGINSLYRDVYRIDIGLPCKFEDFYEKSIKTDDGTMMSHQDFREGNRNYEEFQIPSADVVKEIETILEHNLAWAEYRAVAYQYGFVDGETHHLSEVAEYCGIRQERARMLELKALRKLKNREVLPRTVQSTDELKIEVNSLIDELEEIRKNPIFQREIALTRRLCEISNTPFDCANQAKAFIDNDKPDDMSIDELGLSSRIVNALRREGILTVADVIDVLNKDWPKIRCLGEKSLGEIEEAMHSAGFYSFKI